WQGTFLEVLGRRVVFVADEYYLLAGRPFPHLGTYEELLQHENGIGMAAAFEAAMGGGLADPPGVQSGFFRAIDGAPALGYRAPRTVGGGSRRASGAAGAEASVGAPPLVAILTGEYGARVLEPLVAPFGARVV